MAQLVVAAAGAAIGGMLAPGIVAFGMTGASLGWMAGSMLGSAFAPTQKSSGPQLSDLSVSTSAYGTPIPYVQGHPRISGQIVWASAKREIATTTEQGKGGGGAEYTSYTYEVDLLILLTDNPISAVSRVWSNGELVYNALTGVSTATLGASTQTTLWNRITTYTGSASQLPDPDYEAAVGSVNAPAYRGRGSIFIKSLQLGGSGQIPNLTFEVVADGTVVFVDTYSEGLLCHFDEFVSTNVIKSAIGPNVSSTSGTLDTSAKVYGAASGKPNSIFTPLTATGITGRVDNRPWRAQGWFYVDSSTSGFCFELRDNTTGRFFKLGWSNAFGDSYYSFEAQLATSGGGGRESLTGGPYSIPQNAWNYFCLQHDGAGGLRVFVAGKNGNVTSLDPNPVNPPNFDSISSATWLAGSTVYDRAFFYAPVDEFYFHFLTADEVLYGNTMPIPSAPFTGYEFYDGYTTVTPNPTSLQSVVSSLCSKAGLSAGQYSTTALSAITRPVRSMAISSVSSARTVLDMLAASYHFEAVLSDKIYFRPRASAPAATLTFNELGVVVDSGNSPEPLPLTQANELEIPAQMALTYSNVDGDYQTDTQYSDRLLTGQESTSAMQVPLGFTSSEAKQIVDAMLLDKAVSALTTSVSLGLTRAALEPTDVVLLTGEDGSSYRMRIVKKAEASGVTTLECVQDDSTVFTQTGATSGGTAAQTVVLATPTTTLELLDVPLLRDVDNLPGHYIAVKGSADNWTSAGLYESLDNLTFTPNTTISSQAAIGTCTTTLGAWTGGNVFDEVSSVTVNVGTQQLSSVTRDDILASQSTNAALIGAEVLQYRTATLVSAGVYTLSGFLRGQRGTASTGHAVSERFILLASGGLRFIPLQAGDLGRLRYYKAASAGQKLSAVTSQSLTPAGITLKPFAPVDARANRDTADTVLTWIRQTRLSTRIVGTLGISSPLGETAEAYEVEIYTAGHAAVLRTLTSATPSVTYTSAQQVTDFGSDQSAVAVKIYQISATVGRGTPLITTV